MPNSDSAPQTPPSDARTERHLTVRDLADRYDVSVWTIYRWNHLGSGPPYIKPGGNKVRYRLADVLEWEKGQLRRKAAAA